MGYSCGGTFRVYRDICPDDFSPSPEAEENWRTIRDAEKTEDFWDCLRHEFPCGCDEDELNDFIFHEFGYYARLVGIFPEEEKQKVISALSDTGLQFKEEYYDAGFYVIRFVPVDFDGALFDSDLMSEDLYSGEVIFQCWDDAKKFVESMQLCSF